MKTAFLALAVLVLLSVSAASASVVLHGVEGIVASDFISYETSGLVLDHLGQVWSVNYDGSWARPGSSWNQVPVPVESLRFWVRSSVVTVSDEVYIWVNPQVGWTLAGSLPTSGIQEGAGTPTTVARATPNPNSGLCRVTFQTATVGPVSVQVFDATGRLVRQLQDGPLPIGEFSLAWDGRDDTGQDLPSGVYMAKIQTANEASTAKITLTR